MALLGVGGLVLLGGAAFGYGAWPLVQDSGRSVIAAAWDSLRDFASACGTAAAALWRVLRWPWVPIGGGVVLVTGAVGGWLWVRSGRGRS
jgi:hypothetical protein